MQFYEDIVHFFLTDLHHLLSENTIDLLIITAIYWNMCFNGFFQNDV